MKSEERASHGWTGLVPPLLLLAGQGVISEKDKNELMFWGGVLIVGMLVLYIVQKVIRYSVQSRVHSIHRELGIGTDDLDRMSKSGLLTEEERKKIQEAVARNLMRVTEESAKRKVEEKSSAEQILSASLREAEAGGGKAERKAAPRKKPGSQIGRIEPLTPEKREEPPSPVTGNSRQTSAPSPKSQGPEEPSPGKPSVDLDALLEKGLITPEEYKQLREDSGKEV